MPDITFEKRFMKRTELLRLGIPKEMLEAAYRDPEQNFATKMDPAKANSTIVFDTNGFAKWLARNIRTQKAMMRG